MSGPVGSAIGAAALGEACGRQIIGIDIRRYHLRCESSQTEERRRRIETVIEGSRARARGEHLASAPAVAAAWSEAGGMQWDPSRGATGRCAMVWVALTGDRCQRGTGQAGIPRISWMGG